MPYATLQQLKDRIGLSTFNAKIDGSAVLKDELATNYLLVAAKMINTAALKGGYAVPLVPADLTPDTDLQDEITAWLVEKSHILTRIMFLQVLDTTEKVQAAQLWCEAELSELADGEGLPVDPPSDALEGALLFIGQCGATDRLTPGTFRDINRPPETGFDNRRLS